MVHKRNALNNKWNLSKCFVDREKYVEYINKYNQTFRNKKANFDKNYNSSSTKAFWLDPFLNPNKKQKIGASLLNTNKTYIQSPQDLVLQSALECFKVL